MPNEEKPSGLHLNWQKEVDSEKSEFIIIRLMDTDREGPYELNRIRIPLDWFVIGRPGTYTPTENHTVTVTGAGVGIGGGGISGGAYAHGSKVDMNGDPETNTTMHDARLDATPVEDFSELQEMANRYNDPECETCRWWQANGTGKGDCQRFPPQVSTGRNEAWFPATDSSQFCGEYAAKEIKGNDNGVTY